MIVPTSRGKKLIYPGRGFLQPVLRKRPRPKKAFRDVGAFYEDRQLTFTGDPDDVALAEAVRAELLSGAVPAQPDPRAEALRWWILSHRWGQAYHGNPQEITRGKRQAKKIVTAWVALGGCGFAIQTLAESWRLRVDRSGEIVRPDPPHSTDVDHLLRYCENAMPTEYALQCARLWAAQTDDEDYAAAVAAARALWPDYPNYLRAALVFIVPTEEDLALEVLSQMETDCEGLYDWSRWSPLLAWSLSGPEGFERLAAKTHKHGVGDAAIGFAYLERAPDLINPRVRRNMVTYKYAKEQV